MKKNTVIYVLGGAVVVLLLALVGILAYNYGKGDKPAQAETAPVEKPAPDTVVVREQVAAPAPKPEPEPEPEIQRNVLAESDWHLVGTIAGKGVVMDLSNYDGELHGSYYYSKYGASGALQLDGHVDGGGNVTLEEYNSNNGVYSGYLTGRISRKGVLSGSFTNNRGNTYKVYLKAK